jgi:hypothetical protein
VDFVDIITPDPFEFAYNSKRRSASRNTAGEEFLHVWDSQIQDKERAQRQQKHKQIIDEQAYLSVLQRREEQESDNQRARQLKARVVQEEALLQYERAKEQRLCERRLQILRERDGIRNAEAEH